jgi:uncharacterized membrane protein
VETVAKRVVTTIGEQRWIDEGADPVRGAVAGVLHKAPTVAYVLHGEWLGHPLHAAMISVPVGSWTAGLVMDMLSFTPGSRKLQRGADMATAIGLAGALGAAVAGIADFSTTRGEAKRAAFVHGTTNFAIAGLYGASLFARAARKRTLGVALSSMGYGLLLFSAWLGGELSYQFGVGVRPDASQRAKADGQKATREASSMPHEALG